jgi:protein-arginine kinase
MFTLIFSGVYDLKQFLINFVFISNKKREACLTKQEENINVVCNRRRVDHEV